jgi:hypothetical protein
MAGGDLLEAVVGRDQDQARRRAPAGEADPDARLRQDLRAGERYGATGKGAAPPARSHGTLPYPPPAAGKAGRGGNPRPTRLLRPRPKARLRHRLHVVFGGGVWLPQLVWRQLRMQNPQRVG